MLLRLGVSQNHILCTQSNLANTYEMLGRFDEALQMRRDAYSGTLKIHGKENEGTILEANNYADTFINLERFEEAKTLLRKWMPLARRVLGQGNYTTLLMRSNYARALYKDSDATLDDLRESVETLGSVAPLWTRVFGLSHPDTPNVQRALKNARKALAARAAASSSGAA